MGKGELWPWKEPFEVSDCGTGKETPRASRAERRSTCPLTPWPQRQLCLCLCWDPKPVCSLVSMSVSPFLPLSSAGLSIYSFQALAESVSTRDLVSVCPSLTVRIFRLSLSHRHGSVLSICLPMTPRLLDWMTLRKEAPSHRGSYPLRSKGVHDDYRSQAHSHA